MDQTDPIGAAIASGTHDDALKAIREIDVRLKSLPEAKSQANLLLNKAVFLAILGQFEEAILQLQLALQQAPNDLLINLQFEYIGASICHQQQKFQEALERMNEVLYRYHLQLAKPELKFMYEDIQLQRAFELAQLLRWDEAVPLLQEVLRYEIKPDDRSAALVSLGIGCSRLQRYEEAVKHLVDALNMKLTGDWEGKAHCHLGIAYAHLGRLHDAKRELQICETRASEYRLPLKKVYGWLSRVCSELGDKLESVHYAQLARPS
jgi:tetratricopeptide (TPR) repeat protein